MIEIKNLTKSYDGFKKAIDHVNLEINDGDIYGFVGLNGAGKSTTIKCLVGILNYDEGEIFIDGHKLTQDSLDLKAEMAYVSDNPEIYNYMKGIDYIKFIMSIYGKKFDPEEMLKLAKEIEIDEALNDLVSTYSHGMKQKLVLLAAFLHQPKILVLDEPFVGLDPKATHYLKNKMIDYAKDGNIIFFSTHVLEVAEKLCNKVAIIKNGVIILEGTMEEVIKNSSLEDAFLGANNE